MLKCKKKCHCPNSFCINLKPGMVNLTKPVKNLFGSYFTAKWEEWIRTRCLIVMKMTFSVSLSNIIQKEIFFFFSFCLMVYIFVFCFLFFTSTLHTTEWQSENQISDKKKLKSCKMKSEYFLNVLYHWFWAEM